MNWDRRLAVPGTSSRWKWLERKEASTNPRGYLSRALPTTPWMVRLISGFGVSRNRPWITFMVTRARDLSCGTQRILRGIHALDGRVP